MLHVVLYGFIRPVLLKCLGLNRLAFSLLDFCTCIQFPCGSSQPPCLLRPLFLRVQVSKKTNPHNNENYKQAASHMEKQFEKSGQGSPGGSWGWSWDHLSPRWCSRGVQGTPWDKKVMKNSFLVRSLSCGPPKSAFYILYPIPMIQDIRSELFGTGKYWSLYLWLPFWAYVLERQVVCLGWVANFTHSEAQLTWPHSLIYESLLEVDTHCNLWNR